MIKIDDHKLQERQFIATLILGAFTALMSLIGFFAIKTLNSVEQSIHEGTQSINELNITMTRVLVDQSHQRKDIDRHEIEIRYLKDHILDPKK